MTDLVKQYVVEFNGLYNVDSIQNSKIVSLNGPIKKLITGYTVADGDIQLSKNLKERCSFQFYDGKLKFFLLYPTYKEFLEEEERWNQPTVDGSIEKEACIKWMHNYLGIEEKKEYDWGKAEVIYEQWIGKAAIMYQYHS